MNVLLSFRYLSAFDIDDEIVDQVINSEAIKLMTQDTKYVAVELKSFEKDILTNFSEEKLLIVKKAISFAVNYHISDYNIDLANYSYLWIDEICSIVVRGKKAIPLEDPNTYGDFNDVKECVESAANLLIKNNNESPENFEDLFFVVYIDIIEKSAPLFYW